MHLVRAWGLLPYKVAEADALHMVRLWLPGTPRLLPLWFIDDA